MNAPRRQPWSGGTNGFGCYLFVDFKTQRAVVVMTNYATTGAGNDIAVALHLLHPAKFQRKSLPSVVRSQPLTAPPA